ncbi:hypothetical protein CN354_03645 [Bacillus cereus]|nr:hypothetical protein CN354_03645 [Bacillus cereus]WJE52208.1 hypothetical protein QRE66_23505 [Bacillus cereus]
MIDFLVLLFIFGAGCMILQSLSYRFAKRNIHKYKETKLMPIWLDMHVKKEPKLDVGDYIFILIVCIIWKTWLLPLIK